MSALQLLAVGVVFVLAGVVKGVAGMGLPLVAVSLLGLWLAPAEAAALLVAPSLATNLAQCRGPQWRRLVAMLWPVWLGLVVVTVTLPAVDAAVLGLSPRRWLGMVLIVYGAWGLWRPRLPSLGQRASPVGVVVGAATGVVTATTAVFVVPLVPYLQAMRLDKDAMVQALGLSFTVATLALAVRLQAGGALPLGSAQTLLALAASLVGLWIGSRVRSRISGPAFQRALFAVFIGLGLASLLR